MPEINELLAEIHKSLTFHRERVEHYSKLLDHMLDRRTDEEKNNQLIVKSMDDPIFNAEIFEEMKERIVKGEDPLKVDGGLKNIHLKTKNKNKIL